MKFEGTLLSCRNRESIVWLAEDGFVYKNQPKVLADNEWYALESLSFLLPRYVPVAWRVDDETIKMHRIVCEQVTEPEIFMDHYDRVLQTFRYASLRHGDLTNHSVLVVNNKPMIIDWAESRMWDDPRPDKRREGDAYWLKRTMTEYVQASQSDK